MTRLSAHSLQKSYRSRQVVRDLSLEINTGEVVGLLGPNGAGKTTAFYMIVGLMPADGGSILLDDRDLTPLSIDQRARWAGLSAPGSLGVPQTLGRRQHHGDPGAAR
jgi:lipopolysaccharide export system ATP-binding protein